MDLVGVVGVGKLGLCLALILEDSGYNVIGYDIIDSYIESINTKKLESIEPKLTEYLTKSSNLIVENTLNNIYKLNSIFVVVNTPSKSDGSYDHSAIEDIVTKIIELNEKNPSYNEKLFVITCTVMPQYSQTVQERLSKYNYHVCYNPEFIAQGDIINGMINPDMVLIGGSETGSNKLESIYKNILRNNARICKMSLTEAEITKISLNCFLTTKISYSNLIGDIVLKAGGRPDIVLEAIGSDTRVGNKFLKWGHGYGGPCLPRDNRALSHFSETINIENKIGKATDEVNKLHLDNLCEFLTKKNPTNIPFYFDGIVYKKNTIITEESQRLALARKLSKNFKVIINESPLVKIPDSYLFSFIKENNMLDIDNVMKGIITPTIYKYDRVNYNFFNILQKIFNLNVSLEAIHNLNKNVGQVTFDNDVKTDFHNILYNSPLYSDFVNLYYNFVKNYIFQFFPDEQYLVVQKDPGFRVSTPNNTALGIKNNENINEVIGMHTDGEYNHPETEVNFIIAVTEMVGTNSVFMESEPGKGDFSSVTLKWNEYLMFYGNKCRHYNMKNITGQSRVSIDFRVIPYSKYDSNYTKSSVHTNRKFIVGDYFVLMKKE